MSLPDEECIEYFDEGLFYNIHYNYNPCSSNEATTEPIDECNYGYFNIDRTCMDFGTFCEDPAAMDGCLDCSHCDKNDRMMGQCPECPPKGIEGVIIQTDCDGNPQVDYVLDSLCRTRFNNVDRSASCFIGSNEFELKAFECSDVNTSSQTLQLDHCYSEEFETKF